MITRRKRLEFHPSLEGAPLEVRVVPAVVAPIVRTHDVLLQTEAANRLENSLTAGRLRTTMRNAIRSAATDAWSAINAQVRQLYANGTPTAQQKADFNAAVGGILDATALRLSSLAGLLPGGNAQLVPGIQRALIGSQNGSLANRIASLTESGRATRSVRTLETAITQQLNRAVAGRTAAVNTFLAGNSLNNLSVDATGTAIPLRQYIGNQFITQLGNTLGSLSQSFPTVANSMLFANGATSATTEAQQAFAQQYLSALGITAFTLGNGLGFFSPGLTSNLTSQLQSGLFGTGSSSLFSALQGLPTTSDAFGTAASTVFTNAFQGLTSPLSQFFNLPSSSTFNLPTGNNIPGLFGSEFSNFGNGFNTGFGSGFPGFGTAGTGTTFNPSFGNGFASVLSGLNPTLGFNTPILDGTGSTTGTGTGLGTGTGTTTTGTGTGTGVTGTGTGTGTTGTGTTGGGTTF